MYGRMVGVLGLLGGTQFELGWLAGFLHRHAHMTGHGLTRAVIAAVLDPLLQRGDGRDSRVVRDGRGLRDRVGRDLQHTGKTSDERLGHRFLGSPMQIADVQHSGYCTRSGGVVVVDDLGAGHWFSCRRACG